MTEAHDLLVSRTSLRDMKVATSDISGIADGEALLKVDAFAITANNVTYSVFGDAMKYWDYFPAPDGWGRVPVWGFATVLGSKVNGVNPGQRIYGYLPMSTHLKIRPERVRETGFSDGAAHRRHLPATYQNYSFTTHDPLYRPETEPLQMLYRSLFITSFLIDDYLLDENLFGAKQVLFSSASAKTSYAAARLLTARGVDVIGLTSPKNTRFTAQLGVYKKVVAYGDLESLDPNIPTAFIDIAGDAGIRARVHGHFQNALKLSLLVGATHWDQGAAVDAAPLPGPKPQFFFAPDRVEKRIADWGGEVFNAKSGDAFANFIPVAATSIIVVTGHNLEDAGKVFGGYVAGTSYPRDGNIIRLL